MGGYAVKFMIKIKF